MPKRQLPRFNSAEEPLPPPTLRESVLRYSALVLAVVLILSSLTLRADPKSASLANAVHGNLSGFLPLPVANPAIEDESPKPFDRQPSAVEPPAIISPALAPPDSAGQSFTPETPDSNDSAINIPYTVDGPDRASVKPGRPVSTSEHRLISSHTSSAARFDGD